ncbi:hypothetical protein ACFL2X_05235 [Candidatus Latescibacterota bacterium]
MSCGRVGSLASRTDRQFQPHDGRRRALDSRRMEDPQPRWSGAKRPLHLGLIQNCAKNLYTAICAV